MKNFPLIEHGTPEAHAATLEAMRSVSAGRSMPHEEVVKYLEARREARRKANPSAKGGQVF
jgi:hypothetical protein